MVMEHEATRRGIFSRSVSRVFQAINFEFGRARLNSGL